MARRIQLRETDLTKLIQRIINEEGPIYGPGIGICLCPPPWTPCGCLGQAMNMGIEPEDMDPNDFRGNEDTSRGREFDDYEDGGTELADCRCGGFVEIGEMCPDPLNTRCIPHAGGCHCLEADKAIEDKPNVETMNESDLRRLVHRVINENKRRELNENKTCREAWGECMDWADGVGSHAEQICDDEWCECEGLGGGCSGMVGPSGPKGQQTNKSIGGGCNECTKDSDCDTSYDVGKCTNGCCDGTAAMSRARARALSESDLRRLVKRVINEEPQLLTETCNVGEDCTATLEDGTTHAGVLCMGMYRYDTTCYCNISGFCFDWRTLWPEDGRVRGGNGDNGGRGTGRVVPDSRIRGQQNVIN